MEQVTEVVSSSGTTVQYAFFWRRFGAALIDVIGPLASLGIAFGLSGSVLFGSDWTEQLNSAATILGMLVYWIAMEAHSGQTIGKQAFHIKVVDARTMTHIQGWQSWVRNICKLLVMTPLVILPIICIAATRKHQRIGDMIAKTIVIPD